MLSNDLDNFQLLVNKIALDEILTTEIVRIQDKYTSNCELYLRQVSSLVQKEIKDKITGFDDRTVEEVADYLCGYHSYRIKQKIEHVKAVLPHFAKWHNTASAQNSMLELMSIDSKLNKALKLLMKECMNRDGSIICPDDEEGIVQQKIAILDGLKNIAAKQNKTVSDTIKKYFDPSDNFDLNKIVDAFKNNNA